MFSAQATCLPGTLSARRSRRIADSARTFVGRISVFICSEDIVPNALAQIGGVIRVFSRRSTAV